MKRPSNWPFIFYMKKNKENQEFLMKILITSALIILFSSLEAMFYAKDINSFNNFREINGAISYDQYLNYILFNLFLSTINPIIISLYTFLTINKIEINNIYKMFFGFSTFLSLINVIMQFRVRSIFYYLVIIMHIILFYFIITKERT